MAPVGRADAGHHLALFEFIDLQFNGPFGSTEFFSHCGNGDFCVSSIKSTIAYAVFPEVFPEVFSDEVRSTISAENGKVSHNPPGSCSITGSGNRASWQATKMRSTPRPHASTSPARKKTWATFE